MNTVNAHKSDPSERQTALLLELTIAGLALISLIAVQLMLSSAAPGSTYRGPDGAMIQSTVFAAFKLGGIFDVTTLNPLQAMGSQMLTKNAWANPAFWPFAFFEKEAAAELSSAIALGCFAVACYIMARCFDLAVVPSAIAAQLSIILFGPAVLIIGLPRNFGATPADAITYAPYMIALGLLARLNPGSWRKFALITVGITACLLYSVYCDPAFTMIPAVAWSIAFAVVILAPLCLMAIGVRSAAMFCCLGAFLVSGVAVYLYTLSQYTARVHYAQTLDRPRSLHQVSALYFSSDLHIFYLVFGACLFAGFAITSGRTKTLIVAAIVSWCFYVAYAVVYLLLLGAPWVLPVPIYVEQCLFILFMTGAVAGRLDVGAIDIGTNSFKEAFRRAIQ